MRALDRIAHAVPELAILLSRQQVNHYAEATAPRPHRYSLWSPGPPPDLPTLPACGDYVAWPGLFDRSFTQRHLGPPSAQPPRPDADRVLGLFRRERFHEGRSSALFCFFAQWFTDSFLRTSPSDKRRTDSNHEIDLCQVYGLDEATTVALRAHDGNGRLSTRTDADGREFPPLLFSGGAIDPRFANVNYLRPAIASVDGRAVTVDVAALWEARVDQAFGGIVPGPIGDPARRNSFYAFGLDRGGSTIVYSAVNTIFIREHNRIAAILKREYRDWDDERLFQTARLINMRQLLTIIMESYIAHIAGDVPIPLDRSFAEHEPWYRTNRISIEFNLLYRFHSLAPDTMTIGGEVLGHTDFRYNNSLVERIGIGAVLTGASDTPAGRSQLFNTPGYLWPAEAGSLGMARNFDLAGFNTYREHFGLDRYETIDQLTGDPQTTDRLCAVYGHVDEVEYTVGLLAEHHTEGELFGQTLTTMVAHDAFTHILTNPLLASQIHVPEVFSDIGMTIIEERATFAQLVAKNTPDEGAVVADFRAPGWRD